MPDISNVRISYIDDYPVYTKSYYTWYLVIIPTYNFQFNLLLIPKLGFSFRIKVQLLKI